MDKHRLTQVGRAMKELGVQMIPAYSPQARGRSERSFGTWQGRLPQELRLAGIDDRGGGQPVSAGALHRGVQWEVRGAGGGERNGFPAYRADGSGLDLHACRPSAWWTKTTRWRSGSLAGRLDKTRFATRLAGSTVTIHEHLDGTVSIRYGPHVVADTAQHGRALQAKQSAVEKAEHGSRGKPKAGFPRSHHSLGNLAEGARFPLSHRAGGLACLHQEWEAETETEFGCRLCKSGNPNAGFPLSRRPDSRRRKEGKADRSLTTKTGHLDKLATVPFTCCQGKVEMSYCLQSRNVRLARADGRVRDSLYVSAKRKRALLASNPPRNSRPKLIENDGQDVFLPVRPTAWPGPDQREAVPRPKLTRSYDPIGSIDFVMPKKTPLEGARGSFMRATLSTACNG